MFSDERGNTSSKRFVGIVTALLLCFAFVYSMFTNEPLNVSDSLIDTLAFLSLGCLGLSSVDKWTMKGANNNADSSDNPS